MALHATGDTAGAPASEPPRQSKRMGASVPVLTFSVPLHDCNQPRLHPPGTPVACTPMLTFPGVTFPSVSFRAKYQGVVSPGPSRTPRNRRPSTTGVAITDPGPSGIRAGLKRGDVLRSVDTTEVTDTADAEKALRDASRRLTLDVQRGDQRLVMRFRL